MPKKTKNQFPAMKLSLCQLFGCGACFLLFSHVLKSQPLLGSSRNDSDSDSGLTLSNDVDFYFDYFE